MEAHDLVVRAWTEKDTFAFNGRFNQQRYVNIWPRPVQRPHPPIWVPGGGSVETWHWCAEMDYVYCYLSYYGYKAGRATMDGFWAEMDRLGKHRNPYQAGFLQFIGVGESRQHAFDLYAEAAEYFYGRCLHVDPRWATPPGYTSEGSQRAGIESQVKQAADSNVRGKSTGERFACRRPRNAGDRRQRLRHHRLARRGRRAAARGRDQPQRRSPDAVAAVSAT